MSLVRFRHKFCPNLSLFSKWKFSVYSYSTYSETYTKYHTDLPFTEKEKILINNTIITLLDDYKWISSLAKNGIPSFFVRNSQFRSNLIEYLDKSNDARSFFRNNLSSLLSYNSNGTFSGEVVPSKLTDYIHSYVVDNMPNLALACHSLNHLVDFRSFESDSSRNSVRRNVHLHIGPPNSGKTHNAIARLLQASSGIYCSPLRLLAWEMYSRLNSSGVPCSLLTGQENVENGKNHISCTVEMVSLERNYEVAVLDEMQMVGDPKRGYAWTRAFLGLKTPEVHLCGSPSCLILAKKLADLRGDLLQVTEHTRLGELKVLDKVVRLVDLEPGDCVVCFSRMEAFSLRDQIESISYSWDSRGLGDSGSEPSSPITSIVYGSLPPSTRCDQVEKFNKRETKILIASDVIGMGVNVSIKRIIFHKLAKFDGNSSRVLNSSEVQQIAGRAGRYGMDCGEGQVSCMRKKDLFLLRDLMAEEPPQIEKAVILPKPDVFEAFSSALKQATGSNHSLCDVTQLISSMARTGKSFSMCDFSQVNSVAKCLEGIDLPFEVYKHYLFVPMGSPLTSLVVRAFAASHFLLNSVKIANIVNENCLDLNFEDTNSMSVNNEIKRLELLHESLDIYTWLSNKFPSVYVDGKAIVDLKSKVSSSLSKLLSEIQPSNEEETSDLSVARDIIRPEFLISN